MSMGITTLHDYKYTFERYRLLGQLRVEGRGTVAAASSREALESVVKHLFRRPGRVEARVTIEVATGEVAARWTSAKLAGNEFLRNGGDPETLPGHKESGWLDGMVTFTTYPITEILRD